MSFFPAKIWQNYEYNNNIIIYLTPLGRIYVTLWGYIIPPKQNERTWHVSDMSLDFVVATVRNVQILHECFKVPQEGFFC